MKINKIEFFDGDSILSMGLDTDKDIYICIDKGTNFYIKVSEWDSFIEKLQQAKQLLQSQEDESNNK